MPSRNPTLVAVLCAVQQGTFTWLSYLSGQSRRVPRGASEDEGVTGTHFITCRFSSPTSSIPFHLAQVYQAYVKDLEKYLQSFYQKVNPLIVRRRHFCPVHALTQLHTPSRHKFDVLGLENFGQRIRKSSLRPQTKTYSNVIISVFMHTTGFLINM